MCACMGGHITDTHTQSCGAGGSRLLLKAAQGWWSSSLWDMMDIKTRLESSVCQPLTLPLSAQTPFDKKTTYYLIVSLNNIYFLDNDENGWRCRKHSRLHGRFLFLFSLVPVFHLIHSNLSPYYFIHVIEITLL